MAKTFKEATALEKDSILILDSLNLGFRFKHSGQANFLEEYIETVESLRRSYKCDKVIITCDSGSSSYRKALYPEYKGNREKLRAEQSEADKQAFEVFFKEFNRTMQYYNEEGSYPFFRFNKVEADDIAAYIVGKYKKQYKIWLISSDGDWDLLVDKNVSRFSYVTRKEITLENWHDRYECEPEEYISIKCLQGDTGDNVFGVPGVGPKRALALVKEYGSAYDIIANLPISGKYKYIQNLNAFGVDNLMLNYKLMDLPEFCEEAIGPTNVNTINEVLKDYLNDVQ